MPRQIARWRVVLGSTNPSKLSAVNLTFQQLQCPIELSGVKVPSGVADQPFSDQETMVGALNRARAAVTEANCDIGVGLEGGVEETPLGLFLCNWAAIATPTGEVAAGGGVRIHLPDEIANDVRQGRELGDVIDEWAGKRGVRSEEGTIGILTNGRITRAKMFQDALICALSPLMERLRQ